MLEAEIDSASLTVDVTASNAGAPVVFTLSVENVRAPVVPIVWAAVPFKITVPLMEAGTELLITPLTLIVPEPLNVGVPPMTKFCPIATVAMRARVSRALIPLPKYLLIVNFFMMLLLFEIVCE